MIRRTLRHTANNAHSLLVNNKRHIRAQKYAFLIFRSNAVYSMIPKNACSTMRLSIALENGAIRNVGEAEWIHRNNTTFSPSLKEVMMADYTFAILRCPFARLASCYLDKFAGGAPEKARYNRARGAGPPIGQLTFRAFCESLEDPELADLDHHWAPQTNLLLYDDYDEYFCVEQFDLAAERIREKTGMAIVDARPITLHGADVLTKRGVGERHADTPLRQLTEMKANTEIPDPRSLYDDRLIDVVGRVFAADLAMFQRLFPGQGLFDRQLQSAK